MAMTNMRAESGQPMMEMNTTPLIDVMLVLLIMFIMTIPMATHSLDFNLPAPGIIDPPPLNIDPVVNKVTIDGAGAIAWNDNRVTMSQLAALLSQTRRLPVEPELHYQPAADASYDVSARVMAQIKRSGVTQFGFVGNDAYAEFGKPVQ